MTASAIGLGVPAAAAAIVVGLEIRTAMMQGAPFIASRLATGVLLAEAVLGTLVAPIGGVLAGRETATRTAAAMIATAVAAGTAGALGLATALGGASALERGGAVIPHLVLGISALALAMFGTLCAAAFRDELDAAAISVTAAVAIAFGVLIAGPLVEGWPAWANNAALTASPLVAAASAAHVDVLRSDWLYRMSPIAHQRFDYPEWYAAATWHGAVTLLLFACAAIVRSRRIVHDCSTRG